MNMARNIAPQDISWFLDLHQRDRLDLNPPYQRRSVWTPKERRYFLDTIFNGYPCPPIFLYKSISNEGVATYHVVDGKQRLETILRFTENKIALPEDFPDDRLARRKWKQIDVEAKKQFWNYQFAVEMLGTVDAATVKEIFDRYNRTSKNLERQELRHAKFDGWFITTAEEEAKKEEWKSLGVVTTASARRMRDVQFISELMAVLITGQLRGFSQDELDDIYATYDTPSESDPSFSEDDFITKLEHAKNYILEIEKTNSAITLFGKTATHFYTLWSVVALCISDLPEPKVTAPRYSEFMLRVVDLLKTGLSDEMPNTGLVDEQNRLPFLYAQNSRGASTELPQREQRYKILEQILKDNAQ